MFKKIVINIALNGVALYATTQIVENFAVNGGIITYIYAGLILGLLNGIAKPILKAATFPLKYLTIGLSLIAINIFLFYVADVTMESLFGIKHDIIIQKELVSYIKVGIIFGAINWIEHLIIR